MVVYADGKRSAVAELAREAIETPQKFTILQDPTHYHECLRHFASGMNEQASLSSKHVVLAVDYGNWAFRIWRVLRQHRQKRNESEGVVLIGMHWLERAEQKQRDTAKLKIWW